MVYVKIVKFLQMQKQTAHIKTEENSEKKKEKKFNINKYKYICIRLIEQ